MTSKAFLRVWATCAWLTIAAVPSLAQAQEVVLYGSDAVAIRGNWALTSDATAAGGLMLASADRGVAPPATALPSPPDYVEFSIMAEAGTPYRVWLRLRAAKNLKPNDSLFVQFSDSLASNGTPVYRIGTSSALVANLNTCNNCKLQGWGWVDDAYWLTQSSTVRFAASGSHIVRVQTREDGVQFDQIVISPQAYLTSAPGTRLGDTTIVPKPPPPDPGPRIITVASGGNLQLALDTATPGDVIQLEAGATFTGNFVLAAKSGDSFITIRSSAPDASLPADGVRMNPTYAPLLPKLRSANSMPALKTAAGAHHYKLLFLEFLSNAQGFGDIITLGDGSLAQNNLAMVPHDLIVDRVYIHGDPVYGQKRGIALNSASTSVLNSYISEIKAIGQDSQAVGGWNGPGPFTIVNNYLEAAGENVMFGGADPAILDLVPSDILVARNHLAKLLAWRGTSWNVKNLFELKNARRVVIDGNLMEYNWLAGQSGYAIVFTPRNPGGTAPWSVVEHVQFTNNVVRHVAAGINILGQDNNNPSQLTNNIVIRNNLFEDISSQTYGGHGHLMVINGGANITVDHNTVFQDGATSLYAGGAATTGFVFTNNIIPDYAYAIMGGGTSEGNGTIAFYFPGGVFRRNIIAGGQASRYPADNYFPPTLSDVGFVDLAGGNYRLAPASIYNNAATDGLDVGVDVDRVNAAAGTTY